MISTENAIIEIMVTQANAAHSSEFHFKEPLRISL